MTQPPALPEPSGVPEQEPTPPTTPTASNNQAFANFDNEVLAALHLNPSSGIPTPSPFTPQEVVEFGIAIVDGILAQVLLALANITIGTVKPFAGLQAFAQELQTAASNALAEAEGAQTTATDANNTATTALGFWTTLFTDLGFSVTTASELAAFLSGTATTATSALANWTTLFENLGESAPNATVLATYLSGTNTSAAAALAFWTALFEAFGASVTDATELADFITGTAATATDANTTATSALANWTTLFTDLGESATNAAELATLISGVQNAETAKTAALQTYLTALGTDITGFTNWTTFLPLAEAQWNTYWTTVTDLTSEEVPTLTQILDTIFGIDPASGMTPPTQVEGVGGDQTLADTFNSWVTELGAALGGDVADAGGLAWLAQLMNGLGVNSTSPLAGVVAATQSSAQILSIVDNQPVAAGLEATVESNGDYHQAAALTSATVTKTTSRGALITLSQAKTLGFQQWLGEFTLTPSGFVLNFYKMDSSGNLDFLFTTSDLSPSVASSLQWYLDDITGIDASAGDVIGIEFQIKTSGTIVPWGFTAPAAGNHPTALIKQLGFSQNWNGSAASTIAAGSIGWSPSAPYVGLGVGVVPPPPFFPQSNSFLANSTYTIQPWDVFVDLVGVGGGGGGEGETGLGNGPGGSGGSWATRTLTVGTSGASGIAAGATITVTVGTGGAGSPFFTPGLPGNATTFSWHDSAGTTQTLTAAGGLAGNALNNLTSWGLSPGNQSFEGQNYTGGAQNVIGGVGNSPGGGGTGGSAFQFGFAGAIGQAWIVDRQS